MEGGRDGGREGGREGRREGQSGGRREEWREGRREGGGREGGRNCGGRGEVEILRIIGRVSLSCRYVHIPKLVHLGHCGQHKRSFQVMY